MLCLTFLSADQDGIGSWESCHTAKSIEKFDSRFTATSILTWSMHTLTYIRRRLVSYWLGSLMTRKASCNILGSEWIRESELITSNGPE